MARVPYICSLAAVAILQQGVSAQSVPGRYVWPIEGYTNISAGFCDYRTRHYHGGIDISTNGLEGLPIRAADSGWVGRAVIGYWGFGKAVYVYLAGGGMAVYGHLSEFSEKIQAYVEKEQYRTEQYQQNLFPDAELIPIARGEIIGKSGQTGAGPPHLHFELRTADNRPLNPLNQFFQKADKYPPVIHSVTLVPRQPLAVDENLSTADGSLLPRTYPTQKGTLANNPRITGTVGISVLSDDHIDAPRWTVSPYRLRLFANGIEVGSVRYDSINYDDTRQIDIERYFDSDGGMSSRSVNLFRYDRNTLWHYSEFLADGWLSVENVLKHGANKIRVEVEDAAGNRRGLEFTLTVVDEPLTGASAVAPTSMNFLPSWGGLVVASPGPNPPNVALDAEGVSSISHWVRSNRGWQTWLPASTGTEALWVHHRQGDPSTFIAFGWKPIDVDDGGLVSSPDGQATVTISPGDLYETSYFSLGVRPVDPSSRALTPLYTLEPADMPLARDVQINISIPKTTVPVERLGIYRYRSGSWSFEGNGLENDWNALRATIKSTGTFAILADRTPPRISRVSPQQEVSIRDTRPTIRFGFSDNLSGLGSESDLRLTVDDQWVPVEFDPDLQSAKAQPRWELDPGKHRLEIVARDRSGNEARVSRTFRIVR